MLNSKISDLQNKVNELNIEYKSKQFINAEKSEKEETEKDVIKNQPASIQEKPETDISDNNDNNDKQQYTCEKLINEDIQVQTEYKNSEDKITHKKAVSFENFIIGNIFNIIGAIAIIIGCGIFIRLIQPYIIFSPLLKTLIGLIIGTAMVVGGCKMKKDNLKRYSEILTGTGFAVLFISIYCSAILFKTFPLSVCSVFAILILLSSYYIADKQKTFSMIAIALTGGYLNILLVCHDVPFNITFIYLIFLNLLSIIFVFRNPDKSFINIINILLTFLFGAFPQFINRSNIVNIVYPIILWLVYLAYDFIMRKRKLDFYNKNSLLNWVNLACLLGFGMVIFYKSHLNIGYMLIGTGIVYGILAYYCLIKKSDNYKIYLYSVLASLLVAVYYITDELIIRTALWSIFALILSCIISKYKTYILKNWLIVFLSFALTSLFFIREIYYTTDISSYIPIFNIRLLAFLFPLSGFYLSHLLINKLDNEDLRNISEVLKFSSVTLLYLFIIFELNDFINIKFNLSQVSYSFVKSMLYSIIGYKYAIQMKRYGMIINKEIYNYAAVIIFIISTFILLSFGMSYKPTESYIPVINIRFIAYAAAIYSSVLFAKWIKLDIYRYIAIILGFTLMTTEVIDCVAKYEFITNYIISIFWILYVGVITTIGIFKNDRVLKNTGIWISFLTIGRIFLYDLANIEMIYKLIIFITLGTIFMITSYFYNKNKQ